MTTRRVLILTLGSRGDVQPYVALGKALQARGLTVVLSAPRGFDALIEVNGLSVAPLTIDMQALLHTPEMKAALLTFKGKVAAWRSMKGLIQQQLDEMVTIARDAAPDLILYHPKALVAPYIARGLGVPAVPSFLQPGYVATGDFPPPLTALPDLGRAANRIGGRALVGLMALGHGAVLRPWLARHPELRDGPRLRPLDGYHPDAKPVPRLHAFSRHLVPKPAEWTARDHVTGAWALEGTEAWSPPADLVRFLEAGPPPIYIGFGSMTSQDPHALTAAVLDAVNRSGRRALLSTGWGALVEREVPRDAFVLETAPHDWLFPRCAAVVHHGGAGTTHEGLRAGCPTLVCPLFGDQPFWGRRVAALGVGPDPIPLAKVTAGRLAPALGALTDRSVRNRARDLAAVMRDEAGADGAAGLIQGLA